MAISYDLELATSLLLEQVAREVLDVGRSVGLFDASVTAEQVLRDGAVTPLRTWTRAYERKPAAWAPIVTDFGITPTVAVGFSLYKHDKISEQQDAMVRLVSGLLDQVAGDAALSGMDVIWLMRRNGELTLNERDDIWPGHRLAVMHQSYRRETQSFSEE